MVVIRQGVKEKPETKSSVAGVIQVMAHLLCLIYMSLQREEKRPENTTLPRSKEGGPPVDAHESIGSGIETEA